MIKVMLVEDEPPILRNIKLLIETSGYPFEVTNCAYHGQEALTLLESVTPDVVITDIRMPVMGGLELLTQMKEKHPGIITVILTGFQEFEYAKKAISLGVFDYILKPVSAAAIQELLSNISNILLKKKLEAEYAYFNALISGEGIQQPTTICNTEYSNFVLILTCAGSFPISATDDLIPANEFWRHVNLRDTAQSLAPADTKVWVFPGRSSAEYYILFSTQNDCEKTAAHYISNLSDKIVNDRIPLTTIVSASIGPIGKIRATAQALRSTLMKKIKIGVPQIIFMQDSHSSSNPVDASFLSVDSAMEKSLLNSIQQGNIKFFKAELQQLFEHWQKYQYPQLLVEGLLKLLISECNRLAFSSLPVSLMDLELEINEAMTNSCSYEELFNSIWYIFDHIFNAKNASEDEKDNSSMIMKKVEIFIRENYTEPITHQSLSERFGLVPSYLSKLFKTYIGMSPSEFLTALRIEKAKELLESHPDMLAKDIAYIVGYSDSHYFSRIFKKTTGVWPSEYKTQNSS